MSLHPERPIDQGLWRDEGTFQLLPGQAHLWSISLDQLPLTMPPLGGLLSEEERAHSSRFERADQARAFLCRRLLLRQLLARYARCRPADIRYANGSRGKPMALGAADGIGFNTSSSGNRVLIGFMVGGEIGVDLEELRWRPGLEAVALRYFNPAEQARLAALPEEQRQLQFFHIWTRKEALAKLSGEGLAALDQGTGLWQQASAHDLPMGQGYVAHVALADPRTRVRLMQWAPNGEQLAGPF